MRQLFYSKEQVDFLRDGYKKMRLPALTEAFNAKFNQQRTKDGIKSVLSSRKITCGRPGGRRQGERISLLTPEQVAFVRAEYKKLSRKQLHAAVNEKYGLTLTFSQLVCFLRNHKIRSGRTGHYPKGNVPWCAGKAGTGEIKGNKGSFKPGTRPKNHRPLGAERITRDGYIEVKVAETNPSPTSTAGYYRFKHVVVWEAAHGPVPKGYCLRFVDGDRQHCELDNLVCITRGENARLNQMSFNDLPQAVRPVALNLAKVDQAIYEQGNKGWR